MNLARKILDGPALTKAELLGLLRDDVPLLPLLHEAFLVRERAFGRRVRVQVLNNAQNGRCSEDCGYCPQSTVSEAPLKPYPWKPVEELLAEARAAHEAGAFRYCMVASGRGPADRNIDFLADAVRAIKKEVPVEVCVSVGFLDEDKARRLKEAGVDRLNHNLNTSEQHYSKVCSTHTYNDRLNTLRAATAAGLEQCSGLIVGMGESDEDIVDVTLELRELSIPSIPINFLIPIEGNPLQSDGSLTPARALRILAMVRLANPSAEVRMAGGREGHLRSQESLGLYAANSLFVDGYLTTKGESPREVYQMIRDAGFEVEKADGSVATWEELGLDDAFRVSGSRDILKPSVLATTR
ncbi:MAG: biotin synthase BioB [bacterium]|nr:biotin synthase BioB [bacterium]